MPPARPASRRGRGGDSGSACRSERTAAHHVHLVAPRIRLMPQIRGRHADVLGGVVFVQRRAIVFWLAICSAPLRLTMARHYGMSVPPSLSFKTAS